VIHGGGSIAGLEGRAGECRKLRVLVPVHNVATREKAFAIPHVAEETAAQRFFRLL